MEDGNRMDLQDSEAPHCDFISVHEDIVNRVMQVMPADQQLLDLAEFFRYSEIPPESGSCMYSASPRCAFVISQAF